MVLSRIMLEPGISRADLARDLGFSEMAATRIVRELIAAGLVGESSVSGEAGGRRKNVGRPKTSLRIVESGAFAAGITISAYHSEVSVCDAGGRTVASHRLENFCIGTTSEAARFYAGALRDLIAASGIDAHRIVGVGVALSARTTPEHGEIVASEYFGWTGDGGRFRREIHDILGIPVEVENLSNALATAEMRFGIARDVADFTLVHAATFLGAGIVSNGRLLRSGTGVTGMLGHMRAGKRSLACICGRDDCLNLSATGFALLSRMGRLDHRAFDTSKLSFYSRAVLSALEDDDPSELLAEAGGALAPALDDIAKLLGPEMIVLSGYLGMDDRYFTGVEAALRRDYGYGRESSFRMVRGRISTIESAPLLALHVFFYSDRLDYEHFASLDAVSGKAAHG